MEKTKKELLRQSEKFLEEYVGQWKITQEKKDEILKALNESPDWKWFFDYLSKKLWTKVDIKDKESLRRIIEKKWLNFDELWSDYVKFLWKTTKNVKAKQRLIKQKLNEEIGELQTEKGSLEREISELKDEKSGLEGEIWKMNDEKASLEEDKRSDVHELLKKFNQDGMIWDISVLDSFREQPDWKDLSMEQKIERFSELLFSTWIAETKDVELGKKVTITIPWEKEITLMFSTSGYPEACPRYDEIMDDDIEKRSNNNAKKFWLMCKAEWCEMLSKKTVKQICWILYELFEKLWRNNKNIDKDLYTFAIILFQSLWSDPRGIRLSDKNMRTDYEGNTLYSLLYYPRNQWSSGIMWLCDGDRDQRYLAFCKIWHTNLK